MKPILNSIRRQLGSYMNAIWKQRKITLPLKYELYAGAVRNVSHTRKSHSLKGMTIHPHNISEH